MSRTNSNHKVTVSAQERAREMAAKLKPTAAQAAAQVGPLAKNTGAAAQRGLHAGRSWAAPRVERTGQMLQDNVAPKVADMLSSAARRIEPEKPRSRNWWTLSGIAILIAAGASAAAAALRKRSAASSTEPSAEADTSDGSGTAGEPSTSANTDATGVPHGS